MSRLLHSLNQLLNLKHLTRHQPQEHLPPRDQNSILHRSLGPIILQSSSATEIQPYLMVLCHQQVLPLCSHFSQNPNSHFAQKIQVCQPAQLKMFYPRIQLLHIQSSPAKPVPFNHSLTRLGCLFHFLKLQRRTLQFQQHPALQLRLLLPSLAYLLHRSIFHIKNPILSGTPTGIANNHPG